MRTFAQKTFSLEPVGGCNGHMVVSRRAMQRVWVDPFHAHAQILVGDAHSGAAVRRVLVASAE